MHPMPDANALDTQTERLTPSEEVTRVMHEQMGLVGIFDQITFNPEFMAPDTVHSEIYDPEFDVMLRPSLRTDFVDESRRECTSRIGSEDHRIIYIRAKNYRGETVSVVLSCDIDSSNDFYLAEVYYGDFPARTKEIRPLKSKDSQFFRNEISYVEFFATNISYNRNWVMLSNEEWLPS